MKVVPVAYVRMNEIHHRIEESSSRFSPDGERSLQWY
jgi:hypothetical protein